MTYPARLYTALSLGAALSLALSACAQSPQASAAASPAVSPKASPPAASRSAAYAGHFESDCQQLGENFYTRDLVDLAPADQGGITAHYAKAFHDAEGCQPASLVVVFHMPATQWTFDGTTEVQGRTVDRIQTRPSTAGGLLTASQARPGSIEETSTQFLMRRHGASKALPVDKAVDQVPTKELRLLTSQRLYSSAPDAAPEAYPAELDLENYLQRKADP